MGISHIRVPSASGAYSVHVGSGASKKMATFLDELGPATGIYVLSSARVWRHVRGRIEGSLRGGRRVQTVLFDDREALKELRTVEKICRDLVRAGADRKALLVAVGGGVVGDVSGFVAASFLRGVRLVQVPTTVVALVDSSIGGKTGVNLPEGKNLVGAFYPPKMVVADPDFLVTLPTREYRAGLYEVIKYGVICDARLFAFLEKNIDRILARDGPALDHVIPRCIRAKAEVVGKDERESGLREILNFGHTFGHGLESVTRYRRYSHGEAVGWGMIAAASLGVMIGFTPQADARRIIELVRRVGNLLPWPAGAENALFQAMLTDKKTRGGRLRLVLSPKIGRAETRDDVSTAQIRRVLRSMADTAATLFGRK
jgi:3-dehydroquinate synthase